MCSLFSPVLQVNLNFDPAHAGPSLLHQGQSLKRFLNLDLCAAQRAEITSGQPGSDGCPRCNDSDSTHVVVEKPSLGQQRSSFLISQTESFLQQVTEKTDLRLNLLKMWCSYKLFYFIQLETFEDLIKNENLTHCQKKEVRTTLTCR